jgi:BirA family biotin operon repressor/biotin-[acetyl-CoA-carboxylase] ligase
VLLREVPDASVDRLTLLAGLAAARAIEEAVGQSASSLSAGLGAAGRGGGGRGNMPVPFRVEIKWPNDLLVQGRKLAGILVERRPASRSAPVPPDRAAAVAAAGLGHVVIGIGINVAQAPGDFEPELRARATSLYQATGAIIDRLRIVAPLLRQLDACFGAAGSPAAPDADENVWMPEWKARCGMLGSRIRARSGERLLTGQVLDVAPMQGLILRDDLGATHFLSAQTTTIES